MMIDDDLENLTSAIKFLKSLKKPVELWMIIMWVMKNWLSSFLVTLVPRKPRGLEKIYRAGNLRGKFEDRYNYLQL